MPYTVFESEIAYFGPFWRGWGPPMMPSLADREPWAGDTKAFWKQDISGERPDTSRTRDLAKFPQRIVFSSGTIWGNNTAGIPFNVVDPTTKTTKVTDDAYGTGSVKSPLPTTGPVRIEGDPAGGVDRHAIMYVPLQRLVEHQNLRHQVVKIWFLNIDQWVDNSRGDWDLSKRWNEQRAQGAVAARVPMLPMLVRWEEIVSGLTGGPGITHCMTLALDDYQKGTMEGPARGTDGSLTAHPCAAGTRLRLKGGTHLRFPEFSIERIICLAGERYGFIVVDRSRAGWGGVALAADIRFAAPPEVGGRKVAPLNLLDKLRLETDFEVIPALPAAA